jgi:hypothetical protein
MTQWTQRRLHNERLFAPVPIAGQSVEDGIG